MIEYEGNRGHRAEVEHWVWDCQPSDFATTSPAAPTNDLRIE